MAWSTWNIALFTFLAFLPALFLLHRRWNRSKLRRPPGPRGWPIVGHIFSLGRMPHRTLATLTQIYGPVVWLKFGSIDTMAVGTAKAAANFFKNHDASFADRTIIKAFKSHDFHMGMAFSQYDAHQRFLKRLCNLEMFSNTRINEGARTRQKCVDDLLSWVQEGEGRAVDVARLVFLNSFNLIGNMVLSRDLVDPESKVGSEFFEAFMGVMEGFRLPNISDIFPFLSRFDLQGIMKKMDRDMGKLLGITSELVKQRIIERRAEKEISDNQSRRRKDLLDVLLDFEGKGKNEPAKLSERDVTIFILEMFMAGSESSSSTVEWTLTEILCNPEVMIKIKAELTKVIGPNVKLEEKHIDNLHYLQAVIKESLRLHPVGPLLLPRRARQDVNFLGYHIPQNTQVFVNVWAIGRDPECWHDPLTFDPERFLDSKVDFKGQHFEFLPFGAGRRMCPGIPLAQRSIPLIIGSLLHEFDWKLESHVSPETMDMNEMLTMSLRKLEPLKAIPKKVQRAQCDTNQAN